jgi:hypothetical protein
MTGGQGGQSFGSLRHYVVHTCKLIVNHVALQDIFTEDIFRHVDFPSITEK